MICASQFVERLKEHFGENWGNVQLRMIGHHGDGTRKDFSEVKAILPAGKTRGCIYLVGDKQISIS